MKSLANHLLREGSAVPNYLVNSSLLVGQALRRSAYHERVLRYFYRKNKILIVDIERGDRSALSRRSLDFECPRLCITTELKYPYHNTGTR
jgi:hypothetical protein